LLLPAGLPQAQPLSADRTSNIRTIALQATELDGMIRHSSRKARQRAAEDWPGKVKWRHWGCAPRTLDADCPGRNRD
jgi:hypothetical protein